MSHPRRLVPKNTPFLAVALLAIAACNPSGDDAADDAGETPSAEGEAPTPGGPVATVTGISGPGGLTSPELAAGTFLGKGAVLQAGQTVQTPRGTLAEIELADGTKLRLNEDSAVKAPTDKWPRRIELTRGELVAVAAAAKTPLEIAVGPEMLRVTSGEVQARNVGDARRYAVIAGSASLKTPSKELDLGPGESIDAPLPEDRYEEAPQLSLAPLEDTAWTRTFASAARMSEAVPRGVGSLTARRAGTNTERQALRLTEQAVTVNIAGRVAHTEIEQAFFNDKPAVLEGIYRFPLPSDGSVSGLELLVGNRWMRGEVLEKQRARNIFKQIVDATIPRDPALLEWEQGNLFKLRIFPIPGRGERKVKLSYTQVLPVVGDKLRYRFPMGGSGAGGTPIENFTFTVNVERSELDTDRLGEIETPMLALDRDLDGDVVTMSTEVRNFIPTSDLGVDIPLAESAQRVSAATHLDKDGQAYFMLALRPEFETGRNNGPTNLAFVMDRSHSTAPELWTLGKGIVEAMAATLGPNDRFTVLACDTACDRLPGGLQKTSAGAVADVEGFLSNQDLAGASDVGGMMQAGADALASASGQRVVVYLGDGAPSSGAMAPDELARTLRGPMQGTRVLAVALGSRSDETTLGSVLGAAGGELVRADPRDNVRELVRDLALRARVPMVNGLELELPDGMMMVRTQGTEGLRKGDTLLVAGQLSHEVSGSIRLTGRGLDGPVEATFPVDLDATRDAGAPSSVHKHLARTWAQMQIAHLTKTKGFEAHEEIVKLSQDYTVLSRFTAMLVLENDAMFREFNVVRRAEDKDTWDGKLPTPEEPAVDAEITTKAGEETERDEDRSDLATGRKTLERLGEGGGGRVTGGVIDDQSVTEESKDDEKRRNRGPQPFPGSAPAEDPAPPPPVEPVPEPEPDVFADSSGGSPSQGQEFPTLPDFGENRNKGDIGAADDDGGDGFFDLGDDKDEDGFLPSGSATTKTPSQPRKAKKSRKPKPSPKTSAPMDPWSSGVGGVSGGGSARGGGKRDRRWSRPRASLKVRTVSSPSSRSLARVEDLSRNVSRDPTKRTAHGKLVRAAIRAGHPGAMEFARAWAEVDPDHAPALLSLADMLNTAGDPAAARAYASAVEVRPFNKQQHEDLAIGLTGKGDLTRACSHRHAIVSIDPSKVEHHAELVRCLNSARRTDDARRALTDARSRAEGKRKALEATFATLESELAAVALPPDVELHRGAQLQATVTWTGEDDLDIIVVDKRGRRLSALRPQGRVRVREGTHDETLTMRRVKGSVFVEVVRQSGAPVTTSVSGTLNIKLSSGRKKTVPFTLREGTIRLAKVFWSR